MSDGYLPQLPWHAGAWQALQPLLARGVHALLLTGAAGIGKKSLAVDLARATLCEVRSDGRACGACAGCLLTAAGSHPDLRIVVPDTLAAWRAQAAEDDEESDSADPADANAPEQESEAGGATGRAKRTSREIRIEQVRSLAPFLSTSTHRGGHRVVVLAPAEALNAAAANALLKMLEEPPAGSLFVLVADALDEVLPTIRSRCVLVRVPAPAPAPALAWLRSQAVEDAESALEEAGGAPVLALALASGSGLDTETRAVLGELLARGGRLAAAEVAARVPKTVPVAAALALLQRWGWDLLALSTLRSPAAVRYHRRQSALLGRLSDQCDRGALLTWLDRLSARRAVQDHPLNARLVIEAALIEYIGCFQHVGPPSRQRPAR
jgi:DNA polymerase-3 subunit delta'